MSHHNDDDDAAVIIFSNSSRLNGIPEDKREKIEAILEKANKEVDKVLDKNPNL